jgi:deazaflavin-dependent oxidoreductase (nitroreductase family)
MLRRTVRTVTLALAGLLALAALWFLGMRRKDSAVVRLQRRLNRSFVNPRQMQRAGSRGAWSSVLHHVGRRSGRAYQTPVTAVPTDDGFAIALVYGRGTDWLQNVLASGSATIDHDGAPTAVDRPEIVPLDEEASAFAAEDLRALRLFNVRECLRVHNVRQDVHQAVDQAVG